MQFPAVSPLISVTGQPLRFLVICQARVGYHRFDVRRSWSSSFSLLPFRFPSVVIYRSSPSRLSTWPIIFHLLSSTVLSIFLVSFISFSTLSFVLLSVQLTRNMICIRNSILLTRAGPDRDVCGGQSVTYTVSVYVEEMQCEHTRTQSDAIRIQKYWRRNRGFWYRRRLMYANCTFACVENPN